MSVLRAAWGVYDTWQDRWCPIPQMTYRTALLRASEYNEKEYLGSKRYEAKRIPWVWTSE